jgi:hypothetical protein
MRVAEQLSISDSDSDSDSDFDSVLPLLFHTVLFENVFGRGGDLRMFSRPGPKRCGANFSVVKQEILSGKGGVRCCHFFLELSELYPPSRICIIICKYFKTPIF